jgi:hypothetical protein
MQAEVTALQAKLFVVDASSGIGGSVSAASSGAHHEALNRLEKQVCKDVCVFVCVCLTHVSWRLCKAWDKSAFGGG